MEIVLDCSLSDQRTFYRGKSQGYVLIFRDGKFIDLPFLAKSVTLITISE